MIAYLFAVIKYIIYGTSVFFTGQLTESCDVLDILALRFLMSFVVLWILKSCKILKINVGIKDIFRKNQRSRHLKTLILTGIFEPVLYMVFETLGISMTSSTTTGVILSLIPICSVVCESLVLKEKTTVMQKLFLLVGVIGVAYIAIKTGSNEGTDSFIGITFLVLAVFCGSLFQVFSRKSSRSFNAMEVTYFSCMLGAIAFNAANIVRHIFVGDMLNYFKPYFNSDNLVGFVFLAIISTVIATCMGNYSLGKMQVTTITVGVVFGNEVLYYYHYIGITLIIIRMIGVSSIAIKKDRYGKTQELTGNV